MSPIESFLSLFLMFALLVIVAMVQVVPQRWRKLYAIASGAFVLAILATLVIGGWEALHNSVLRYGLLTYVWFALLGWAGYAAWKRGRRIVAAVAAAVIVVTIVTMPDLTMDVSERRFMMLGSPEVSWTSETASTVVVARSFVNWQSNGGQAVAGRSGREKMYVEGTTARIVARAQNPVFPWCTNTRVALLGM